MPINIPQDQSQISGPWGQGMFPPWYAQAVEAQGMDPVTAANIFVNTYIRANPGTDFGPYWNSFREGGTNAGQEFHNPSLGNPGGGAAGQPTPAPPELPDPGQGQGQGQGQGTTPHGQIPPRPTTPPPGQHLGRWVLRGNQNFGYRWDWEARQVPHQTPPATPPAPPAVPPVAPPGPPQNQDTDPPGPTGAPAPPVVPPVTPPPNPGGGPGGWLTQQYNSASAPRPNRQGMFNRPQDPAVQNVQASFSGNNRRSSIPRLMG